jgi:hypothetical protein
MASFDEVKPTHLTTMNNEYPHVLSRHAVVKSSISKQKQIPLCPLLKILWSRMASTSHSRSPSSVMTGGGASMVCERQPFATFRSKRTPVSVCVLHREPGRRYIRRRNLQFFGNGVQVQKAATFRQLSGLNKSGCSASRSDSTRCKTFPTHNCCWVLLYWVRFVYQVLWPDCMRNNSRDIYNGQSKEDDPA